MNKVKELPLGTEVKFPFGKVIVEEHLGCGGCLFDSLNGCNDEGVGLFGVCAESFRSDKKNVIFKAYEKGG